MRHSSLYSKIIIMSVILLLSISPVFATDNCGGDYSNQISELIKILLGSLSWLRIPLATFAGKLMGNGFIYGEFFNLDKIFYLLWNFSRTFGNYLVGGMVLYKLIELLLTKGEFNSNEMMKYILKVGGAVLLANMSRFVIGATIDISTILTSTVGSLPSAFVSQNQIVREDMIKAIQVTRGQYHQKINLSSLLCKDNTKTIEYSSQTKAQETKISETDEEILDKIMPKEDSVTGPLMYIGIGVLKIQDFMYDTKIPDTMTVDIFITITRVSITLIFVIILIMLIVINVFRIVTIWFAVSFAPLLIIASVLGGGKEMRTESDFLKNFSMKNIIRSIFAPVVAVGLMSIGLIVIVVMQGFLQLTDNIEIDNITLNNTTQGSTMQVDGIMDTTIKGDVLGQVDGTPVKNTFTNILLIIFTLFILYGIVKALMKFMEGTIGGDAIQSVGKLSGNLLNSIPIGGFSIDNMGSIYRSTRDGVNKKLQERGIDLTGGTSRQDTNLQNKLNKIFNLPTVLNQNEYQPLEKYTKSLESQTSQLDQNGFNKFFELYEPIKKHYAQSDQKTLGTSLSGMSGIGTSFEGFLKKASESSSVKNLYPGSNLGTWIKTDGTAHTIESYIQTNYNNNNDSNKKFFNDIYIKLGGDPSRLKPNRSDFFSGKFHRAGEPISTTSTP